MPGRGGGRGGGGGRCSADPCHVVADGPEDAGTWDGFVGQVSDPESEAAPGVAEPLGDGRGLAVGTGGDGIFPVYVERTPDGRVARVVVELDRY
jgi:hypothetical protein